MDEDGNVFYVDEDNYGVAAREASGIDFRSVVALDEYRAQRNELDEAVRRADQNRRDRVDLGEIRARNTDNENPLSMEEKQADKGRMDEIEAAGRDNQAYIAREAGKNISALPVLGEKAEIASVSMAEPRP
jgi:hypothetical protein